MDALVCNWLLRSYESDVQIHGAQTVEGIQALETIAVDDCVIVPLRRVYIPRALHGRAVCWAWLPFFALPIPGNQVPGLGPAEGESSRGTRKGRSGKN